MGPKFQFASAPDSWGVLDYPGPSWEQSYEKMLDEMAAAGYEGTELGPYGFFPTDADVLRPQLEKRHLKLLASFVPVALGDESQAKTVVEQIRKVGSSEGLRTLQEEALRLVQSGVTTVSEVVRSIYVVGS